MADLLQGKLRLEEMNDQLLGRIGRLRERYASLRTDPLTRLERTFRVRCLERLHVFMRLAVENCFSGHPVVATLLGRGVIETAGLLALFESKIAKASSGGAIERADIVRKFVFSSRKFGESKQAVHALDCVRATKTYHQEVEELYDLLCEAVHPNWLGVRKFQEFEQQDGEMTEYDVFMVSAVFQALFVGHNVVQGLMDGGAESISPDHL